MHDAVFIHEKAIVEPGAQIGLRSRINAFAHLLPGVRIGDDCEIGDLVFIASDVTAANRVTIQNGAYLGTGVVLEDDVLIGPHVTFSAEPYPMDSRTAAQRRPTVIRQGASIGSNATILAGVVIGQNAVVGAGAVVAKDVPPHAVVTGNPAFIEGYVSSDKSRPLAAPQTVLKPGEAVRSLEVRGVRVHQMPQLEDLRGSLTFGEIGRHLPFPPQRYFVVFDVPNQKLRGEHAHKKLHQFLVCLRGSFSLLVDDGQNRVQVTLDSPTFGVHVPPLVWAAQFNFTHDAIMLVLASDVYQADDYIRDYDQFLAQVKGQAA